MVIRKNVMTKDSGTKSKFGTKNLELGNDCKTYITPEGDVYKSGQIYTEVEAKKAEKLLSYKDEKGIRFFYEVTQESLAKRRRAKQIALQRVADRMANEMLASGESLEGGTEEDLDTGVVTLKDKQGKSVGKVEV